LGTFSILYLVFALVYLAAYIVPLAMANSGKRMARKPYAIRTVIGILALVVVNVIVSAIGEGSAALVATGVMLLGSVALSVFLVLWSAHRAQDIGWSKWWCLIFLIPLVGLVFWFVLLFKAGKITAEDTISAATIS